MRVRSGVVGLVGGVLALAVGGFSVAGPSAAGPSVAATGPAVTATDPRPAPAACASQLVPFGPPPSTAPSTAPATAPSSAPSSAPSPLPSPASTVGGERLARPGMQVDPGLAGQPPSPIRASAWLVADLSSGAVLAACNAHVPLAPASTLKVLTALALIHRIDPQGVYTARQEDAAIDGTKAGLVPGSRYSVGNLWHGLLMSSANDCASALAELVGGPAAAAELLQQTARELGAADTVVANTSGLDAPGQVSSAYDLAVFGRAALADPAITTVMRTRQYAFPAAGTAIAGGSGRTAYQIQNHNRLLANYPGATGVKNGYTVAAGGSFIGSATRGGRSYLVVVLRADTNTWRAAAGLLDWAFAAAPIPGGEGATAVGWLPGSGPAGQGTQSSGTAIARGPSRVSPAGSSGAASASASASASTSASASGWPGAGGRVAVVGAAVAVAAGALGVGGAVRRRRSRRPASRRAA